ncbi:hypothetical protein HYALB_00011930 [Hymenoscyphus albidus]|uniref:Uncharacterized protein n=1 Tax=Hymenoscyphus albidus TaxID=595503 RepID=A0A9N9Q3X4_9HELO|nr:hypothetical protein HYALB_00011930 [Hymenoscyphus albidus]
MVGMLMERFWVIFNHNWVSNSAPCAGGSSESQSEKVKEKDSDERFSCDVRTSRKEDYSPPDNRTRMNVEERTSPALRQILREKVKLALNLPGHSENTIQNL